MVDKEILDRLEKLENEQVFRELRYIGEQNDLMRYQMQAQSAYRDFLNKKSEIDEELNRLKGERVKAHSGESCNFSIFSLLACIVCVVSVYFMFIFRS